MNKHTVIVIVASIVIASPFVFAAWNVYAIESLQVRWGNPDDFSYFRMSNHGTTEFCNPSPFFVSFDKFEIITYFDERNTGVYTTDGQTIPPTSSSLVDGNFRSDEFSESQYIFMHMDGQFGGTMPIRLDPNLMYVETNFQTSLLGLIPISITNEYSGFDFMDIMKDNTGNFDC